MIKAVEILKIDFYTIICKFNNGEVKKIEVDKVLSTSDPYYAKVLNTEIFKTVKIGQQGQLYWQNVAQIKELDGTYTACEYDISPEFLYNFSTK